LVIERRISGQKGNPEEEDKFLSLRPTKLSEYVGQKNLIDKLSIAMDASLKREEPVRHILFHGPPGLGKTTLSHIISEEMNSRLVKTSGPALSRPADLMGILTSLQEGDILFIDEIHRLPRAVEEFLYPAIEDFQVDFVIDQGPMARTMNFSLKHFTLVGATTRPGSITAALRDRFYLMYHVDFYTEKELEIIIKQSAKRLKIQIQEEASSELAKRSRGTPRTANRLLLWVRDYIHSKGTKNITLESTKEALAMENVDEKGLDELDRNYLKTIIELYNGGPVGVEALAATLNEDTDTLVDMVEPYLLRTSFLKRTRSGRCASDLAFTHLGLKVPKDFQNDFSFNENSS